MKTAALVTAVMAMFLFSGCGDADYSRPTTRKVTVEGHDWIVFRVDGNYGQTYVHDPDCRCRNAD